MWSDIADAGKSMNSSICKRLTRMPLGRTERGTEMTARSHSVFQILNQGSKPAWTEVWHLWTILIPRRSITGRLVFGRVWRRHDGRHWIYKKFIEYTDDRDEC
jgi:hypothetical protein